MSLHDDVLSSSWFHNANENKNENESFNKSIDNENFNADRETYDSLFAKRLAKELNKRSKECMLAGEKIGLLELELKSVRTQLNSVLRVSSYNKSYNNNSIKHFHTINKVASNSIDNAAATVANLLVDELENTKNELEKCQKELSKSFKREQEYQTKLSSLYEELTNRTDELNSFGNSNVIEKTTILREGILGLKSAMLNFDQGDDNSTTTNDTNGGSFNLMRAKQASIELELSRLCSTSTLSISNYKELEHERTFLLSCVKDDNLKIVELKKKVESFACKLRTSDYMCEASDQRAQQTEGLLNIEKEKYVKLDNDLKLLKLENLELSKRYETVMYDSQQISINFHKEINHSKELHDLNITLTDKIKTLEVKMNSKNDELKELKLKLNELNRLYGIICAEEESNRRSIKQQENELSKLYEEKTVLKQEYLDVDLLNDEKLFLQKERNEILSELHHLRPIADLVNKLESDLTFSEQLNNSSISLCDSSVSRSHLLWSKLPSLAAILPNLQAHMQNLLEQVQHSELQFNNMLNENAEIRRYAHNVLFERDTAIKEISHRDIIINDLNRRIYKLESELSTQLGSCALLNQVKQCIAKYPEVLELLFDKRIDDIPRDLSHDTSGNLSLCLASSGNIIEDSNLLDVKPLRDQLDDIRVKYNMLLQENSNFKDIYNDANESMNDLLYINEKLKNDASSFSHTYNETKKVNNLLQDQLLNAKNEIVIKNAQLSTLTEREKSMQEALWLAIRKTNIDDSNFSSSLTHLGVLLKYAIDNFIVPDAKDAKSKGNYSPLVTHSTPITRTPQLVRARSSKWSNESKNFSSNSSSPDFLSVTPTSLTDNIKRQKSILFDCKESI